MTAYQLLPDLLPDEYAALRADIAAHGVRVPVDVDEHGQVLDGHHRSLIAAELGVDCPRRVLAGLGEAEKVQHALAVNVHRRTLTREQKRDLLAASIRSEPEASDREHARRIGTSPTTVADVRGELESSGQVSNLDSRRGADGRTRPASQPPRPQPSPSSAPALSPSAADATRPLADGGEPPSPTPEPVAATTEAAPAHPTSAAPSSPAPTSTEEADPTRLPSLGAGEPDVPDLTGVAMTREEFEAKIAAQRAQDEAEAERLDLSEQEWADAAARHTEDGTVAQINREQPYSLAVIALAEAAKAITSQRDPAELGRNVPTVNAYRVADIAAAHRYLTAFLDAAGRLENAS